MSAVKSFSDISGYLLGDARKILHESGITINKIVETSSPRAEKGEIEDGFRVIRVIYQNENTCELLVCKPL